MYIFKKSHAPFNNEEYSFQKYLFVYKKIKIFTTNNSFPNISAVPSNKMIST